MRVLRIVLIAVAAVAACLVAFLWWAGSGTTERLSWVDGPAAERAALPDTFIVMTYNVGYLSGMTNNRAVEREPNAFAENLDRVAATVERVRPDVVAFQEIDLGSRRSFYVNQVDSLADRGRFGARAVAVNWDERYVPFPSVSPQHHFGRVLSGQAVLSRFPVDEQARIELPAPDGAPLYESDWLARLAMRFYIDRLAQVTLLATEPPVAVVNVHFEAWDAAVREAQAERIVSIYDSLRTHYAVFVVGDLNSVMPAAKHAGRLRPDELERFENDTSIDILLERTGLVGALPDSVFDRADPSTFTYSSVDPHVTIDHIFYDPRHFDVVDVRVLDVEGPPSDHRPVVARFARRASGTAQAGMEVEEAPPGL